MMLGLGRWFVGVVAVGSLAMACAAPPPVKKNAVACNPATEECGPTSGPRRDPDDGTLKTTTGSPLEAPDKAKPKPGKDADDAQPTETDPTTTPDENDVPLPTPRPQEPVEEPITGAMCLKLKTCCGNLRTAGITGSANQCDRTVVDNDEVMCDLANETYKTPDDYYDPVCF